MKLLIYTYLVSTTNRRYYVLKLFGVTPDNISNYVLWPAVYAEHVFLLEQIKLVRIVVAGIVTLTAIYTSSYYSSNYVPHYCWQMRANVSFSTRQ